MRCVSLLVFGSLLGVGPLGCEGEEPGPRAETPTQDGGGTVDVGRGDGDQEPVPEVPACVGAVAQIYDPLGEPAALTSFPDDFWTTGDPSTPTGLRLAIDASTPWVAALEARYAAVVAQLEGLDGFGTSAPIFLAFDGPVRPITAVTPGLELLDLGDDEAVAVPYEPRVLDDGRTLALWPIWPLRAGTPHAVVLRAPYGAADGGCIAQSPTLARLLAGEARPGEQPVASGLATLRARTGYAAGEIQAASVFTTQSLHAGADASVAVAVDIAARAFRPSGPLTCRDVGAQRACEGRFTANDYRGTDGVVRSSTPARTYELPFSVWMPRERPGPFATYVVGHGLGGDRRLGELVSQLTGDAPVAVVAIDAVAHGQHPAGAPVNALNLLTEFFALDLATLRLDALRLRDNFRQSTFDKLQLLALILQNPDLDGDGRPDVDPERIGYFGVSLGGIMGPEYLALNAVTRNAVLGVPGARLSQIMRDSPAFEVLVRTYLPARLPAGFKERMFGYVQTLVERGDPVNYARHVLTDRLPPGGTVVPDVLLVMAIDDEIVPNSATVALARSLQVPLVAPVVRPTNYLPSADVVPTRANIGGRTGGMAQYTEITYRDNRGVFRREAATHENVMVGSETIRQVQAFFASWAATGVAEIVDPFAR
jgi:hypothetical protein